VGFQSHYTTDAVGFVMSEWQDISTAPKDGSIILATDGKAVFAAYWNLAAKAFGRDKGFPWAFLDETNGVNGAVDDYFIGWQPLPAPWQPDQWLGFGKVD
jgi:hypothetical protein